VTYQPYDFQLELADKIESAFGSVDRVLATAPTGAGKTVIAAEVIRRWPRGVLFLAHRSEIIDQTAEKLKKNGIPHGVIQSGKDDQLRPMARVQVASVQTMHARGEAPPASLIIVDECHHVLGKTYKQIIQKYPGAKILGLTATPCRGDGRGLGGVFERLETGPQVKDLINRKVLVNSLVYSKKIDLKGIKSRGGDYVVDGLESAVNLPSMVGDVVTHWAKYGMGRPTVVFAVSVAHSIHLTNQFREFGVQAAHLDGHTCSRERVDILARLASGEIQILCNNLVLTEGWDSPSVSCCILARPTKKLGLYKQMVGRVLRAHPGKENAIVIDHSGAVHMHGLPDDHVAWTLDPDTKANVPAHDLRKGDAQMQLVACKCGALRKGGLPCLVCGWMPVPKGRYHEFMDGDLFRVGTVNKGPSREVMQSWFSQLVSLQMKRGYQRGWVSHKFREKFKQWPENLNYREESPSPEVLAWVKSRQIAYAKRKSLVS